MTKILTHKILYVLALVIGLTGIVSLDMTPALAGGDQEMVTYVEVRGNKTVATSTILSQVRTEIGGPLSTNQLSEDLKRLYGLGFFKDVRIEQDRSAAGLKIVFVVEEKAVLKKITIQGAHDVKKTDIERQVLASEGDYVDEQSIRTDVQRVRNLYEEQGFYDAKIDYHLDYDHIANQASLVIDVDEGAKKRIKEIRFEGVSELAESKVRKRISTQTTSWFKSGLLREDELELDLQRILAVYDENGFSDAKVDFRLEPAPNGKDGESILFFMITEGPRYLVGDVTVTGNKAFTYDEILEVVDMKPGEAFSRRGLRSSVSQMQDLYFEKGYMNAKILFDSAFNEKTNHVDTKYSITENKITYVGRVRIEGNTKTKDVVIRRELRAYPGEAFNGVALKRSKERLFNMGYFEEVTFDIEDTPDPDRKDLIVRVQEAKTGEFSFGGGFSSIDKVLGFVQIRQRNFDVSKHPTYQGGGQDLRLRLEVSELRTNGQVSWTDPWFMGNPFSFGFDAYRKEINRTRSSGIFFDETRTGGRLRYGKALTDHDTLNAVYRLEEVELADIPENASSEVRAEEGENVVSSIGATYTRDYRNSRFSPSEGYILQGGPEFAGGFLGGDDDFYRLTGMGAIYFKHFKEWVLELKIRGGWSDGFDDTERVPIFERFYIGGSNTVRGYRERRIGPRDSGTRDPIGGESYFVGNAEYTFPIYPDVIKGAIFYDVGAAYLEDEIGDGDIASGMGVGVRVKTPIGPVKIDLGYPLDEIEGEDQEIRFHFNISQGF